MRATEAVGVGAGDGVSPASVDVIDVDAGAVLTKAVLTRDGSRRADAFVILDGRGEVLIDGLPLAGVGPGEFIGLTALVEPAARAVALRAATPMRVLAFGIGT